MFQHPNSSSFIPFLKNLVDQDRLIFEEYDLSKRMKADIAYFSPWIICLDTDAPQPILTIAKSYHSWAELQSPDYPVGQLSLSIAKQYERGRSSSNWESRPIAKDKLRKFSRDKILRLKRELLQREKILKESREILSYLINSSPIEDT